MKRKNEVLPQRKQFYPILMILSTVTIELTNFNSQEEKDHS